MDEHKRRQRRETLYDPTGVGSIDAHALEVSALVRELQQHLDRLRQGDASAEELSVVREMVRAARRARRGEA